MIMIETQYRDGYRGHSKGSMEPPFFDRPLTSLNKLLKMLGKLKSVYQSHNHLLQDFKVTRHSLILLQNHWKLCHPAPDTQ